MAAELGAPVFMTLCYRDLSGRFRLCLSLVDLRLIEEWNLDSIFLI